MRGKSLKKYKIEFREEGAIFVRRFSFWKWLFGYERKKCPGCKDITYFDSNTMCIVGETCQECGYNKVMDNILNESTKRR